ncbi:MAG: tRNA 2-thiouridine(34) synthase MnmA [Deltaproteobacteria bacterium]|nr:tRNA 2-thiouridine(34) synthase MnmA [Deltaproteobacteria bacterium]
MSDSAEIKRVVCAMSGGVDSSVSALLLHQAGYDVLGVSMQVWDYRNNGGSCSRATCCSPDDFTDARRVAGRVGIPYYVFDFEKSFKAKVIDNFVEKYSKGLTPNPCIDCNNKVKFRELRDRAEKIGCDAVATGHFARVMQDKQGYHLLRGVDSNKDQSYFLYSLTQAELARTIFPVGEMTKEQVRELAREFDLNTADKAESQDICFVSGSVQDFIAKQGGKTPPGDIVDKAGRKLGSHQGVHRYTVGQRRGLDIGGADEALYVIELDAQNNRVIVGPKEDLRIDRFKVSELSWISPAHISQDAPSTFECVAQLRHRHAGVPVRVNLVDNEAEVEFLEEHSTVSPGQAAVFYDQSNQEVLGGGRILPKLSIIN